MNNYIEAVCIGKPLDLPNTTKRQNNGSSTLKSPPPLGIHIERIYFL